MNKIYIEKTNEKEFLKDVINLLYFKYKIEVNSIFSESEFNEIEELTFFIYKKVLEEFILKKIHQFGVEDYGIKMNYNDFIIATFIGHRVKKIKKWWGHNYENKINKKYVKKSHHKKKELSLDEINKRERWRKKFLKDKKKHGWCFNGKSYYNYHRRSLLEKEKEKEMKEELSSFLSSSVC